MKRLAIISFLFIIIVITTLAGSKLINANTKVKEKKDIITYQESKEKYLTHYNYTIDNPNIIINPYGNSPLTALIIFETPEEEEITITILGKDDNSTYKNTFIKSKVHYIPVLGLYPNHNNKINMKSNNYNKDITIKTEPLPSNLKPLKKNNSTNNLYFISDENYTYAVDNNNEVRWYIKSKYNNKISRLSSGNLLISSNSLIDKYHSTGLVEIDLLGKVYNEYDIKTGYYGSYTETENSLYVLSKDLIEINKENGQEKVKYKLDDNYTSIEFKNNTLFLKNNNKTKEINTVTNEEKETTTSNRTNENEVLLSLYNIKDYKISKGIKFTNKDKTKISNKKIFLFNYKKKDMNYFKHKIKLTKESDRLVIKGDFTNSEDAYIILDKFLDKKVYNINNGLNYINNKGLNGDYSIYIKINKDIYKTNNYVNF